jgi:translation initiation factor IF-2
VGTISEGDVLLAASVPGDCIVIGFGVKADAKARRLADREGVVLLTYDIIYDLTDEIERALKRRLAPEYEEVQIGEAEVRDLFKIPAGVVAGCYITEGKVVRKGKVRVLRQEDEVFVGDIASLHRFTEDVREVQAGRECGIRLQDFDDVQVGDRFIIFTMKEVEH